MVVMHKNLWLIAVFVFAVSMLGAQVQSDGDTKWPFTTEFSGGELKPSMWLGLKSVFSAGYNLETNAAGFRNLGGSDMTYAIFIITLVNGKNSAKLFEVPKDLSDDVWSARFKMFNFNERLGSGWTESRGPSWLTEITGKGVHIGFFTQGGELVGSLDDDTPSLKPRLSIAGGDMVLPLGGTGDNDLGEIYYEKDDASHKTKYTSTEGAIWYTGYAKKNLYNTYLTLLSEGNVDSDVRDGKNDAFAGVVDFEITPRGVETDEYNPFTLKISGNAIGGIKWENTTESIGYGLKVEPSIYLKSLGYALTPVAAFDGKHNTDNNFTWKIGGGFTLQLSDMRFVYDTWGKNKTLLNQGFRWVNDNVWRYAYMQVYGAYSAADDFDMVFMFEEPEGELGFHNRLGAMAEFRLYNLTEKQKTMTCAFQGRISYDLPKGPYLFSPYLMSYIDSDQVFKLRIGSQANIIPNTGFEISYTSANLNPNANTSLKPGGLSFYDGIFDAGRVELTVILQSDNKRPKTPMRQDFWNYSKYTSGMTGNN
jgi:hypothetical protein